MGTRTAIFQEQQNEQCKGIYVHYDGYIEGVGAMLHLAYQDIQKSWMMMKVSIILLTIE